MFLSCLLPDQTAFDLNYGGSDTKQCPPTPKRIRRTVANRELDDPKTLLFFGLSDEKLRSRSFEWDATIGSGAFTESWRVIKKDTTEKYAVNKSKQKMSSLKERAALLAALSNLTKLVDGGRWPPNILPHYSIWQEEGRFFVQSELCEKGDLGRLFDQKAERGLLVESDVWKVITQILPAIDYMHARGVLHMDVKPANIYVTKDDVLKLGDFGTCVYRDKWHHERTEHEGDAAFLAPEVLTDARLSPAADVFSFGMTLHRLVTGYCVSTSALLNPSRILSRCHFKLSPTLEKIILGMLRPNPEERIKPSSLLQSLGLTPSSISDSASQSSSSYSSSTSSASFTTSSSFNDLGKWIENGLSGSESACESPLVLKRGSPRTPIRKLPMGRGRRLRSLSSTLHYLK